MPTVTVDPRNAGRRGAQGIERNTDEVKYIVRNAADETEAVNAVLEVAPATFRNKPLQYVDYDEVDSEAGLYDCTAVYELPPLVDLQQPGDSAFSFDTTGGTQHVDSALLEVKFLDPAGAVIAGATYGGAIGVDENGEVQGVDIIASRYQFQETVLYEDSQVTENLKRNFIINTARMNAAKFEDLERGECLFLGASGSKRGDEKWSISKSFAGNPNLTTTNTLKVAGVTVNDKLGWDYLWAKYQTKEDVTQKWLAKDLVCLVISRVYQFGDFTTISA